MSKGTVTHCRHCGCAPAKMPRQLCWGCYKTPAVRLRYPSASKFGRRYDDEPAHTGCVMPRPTDAPPGTAEKVAAMERRAARGEALFHPLDARWTEAAAGRFTLLVEGGERGAGARTQVGPCSVAGCERAARTLGMCQAHYCRQYRQRS